MNTVLSSTREQLEAELKAAGAVFKGKSCTCPFHDDKHPSAGVYESESGSWKFKCQTATCGFHGDVYDVRAKVKGCDLATVLKLANTGQEKPVTKRVFPSIDAIRKSVSAMGEVQDIYQYTNPDTHRVEAVQVRYWNADRNGKGFLTHHAAEGGFVLGAPEKPWPIYNRARVTKSPFVVVVEGEKCVHALNKIGIIATTSLSGALNADKADWSLLAGKQVYVWPDNDDAGNSYIADVIEILDSLDPKPTILRVGIEGLKLEKGGDVADLIDAGASNEDIWTILKECSEPCGAQSDLLARLHAITQGTWSSLLWPWPILGKLSKSLFPGTITVICGDPAASKSFLLLQALHWWHFHETNVACYMLEDDRAFHLNRLFAVLSGRWEVLDDVWGKEKASELHQLYATHKAELESFSDRISAAPIGHVDYKRIIQWVKDKCIAGAKIIAIDPITAVYTSENRQIEDLDFIREVSTVIREYGARLILVTHPRLGTANKKATSTMDDLAGGRAFSRHTHTVLWLHRHDPPKSMLCDAGIGRAYLQCNRSIVIAKSRNGRGHGFEIGFNFDHSVRFAEQGVVIREEG